MLDQQGFLSSSNNSSIWPRGEQTVDEDTSGLDYLLALSLQNDAESVASATERAPWTNVWDHKFGKTTNTSLMSSLYPTNNNYQNRTTATTTSAVQDQDQTGKIMFMLLQQMEICSCQCNTNPNFIVDTMLPCEFCEELFPEDDLILHQV